MQRYPNRVFGGRQLDLLLSFFLFGLIFLACGFFLAGPFDSLKRIFLKVDTIPSGSFNNILIFVCATGAIYLFLLRRSLRAFAGKKSNLHRFWRSQPIPAWMTRLYIGVCGLILVRALYDLKSPLEADEVEQMARLARGFNGGYLLREFFGGSLNHALPKALTFLGVTLFGFSDVSARLPSIFFAALVLVAAYRLLSYLPNTYARLLFIGSLLANAFFRFYFVSMRGYAAELFFTTGLFSCYLALFFNPVKLTPGRISIFLFFACGALVSHNFGIFFVVALSVAFLITSAEKEVQLAARSHQTGLAYSSLLLLGGPLFGLLFIRLAGFLHFSKIIPQLEEFHAILLAPFLSVGFSFDWQSKTVLLILTVLIVYTYGVARPKSYFVRTLFFVMAIGQILVLELVPHPTLSSRFFLPFSSVIVIFFGIVSSEVRNVKQRRIFQSLGLIVFVLLPFLNSGKVLLPVSKVTNDERIGRHFPHWDYCRCTTAPNDADYCKVEGIRSMRLVFQDSLRRPAGFSKCNEAGCIATFRSKYEQVCSQMVTPENL